jgi:hypothetical protein
LKLFHVEIFLDDRVLKHGIEGDDGEFIPRG